MEQKRTLWVIAAVGVFLLVVLGAALMLYAPQTRTVQTIAGSRGNNNGTASNGWISLAPSSPSQGRPYDFQTDNRPEQNPFDSAEPVIPGSEFRTDEVNIYADNANLYTENTNMNGLGDSKISQPSQTIINNTTTIDLNGSQATVTQNGNNVAKTDTEKPKVSKPKETVVASNSGKTEPVTKVKQPVKNVKISTVSSNSDAKNETGSVKAKAPSKVSSSKTSKTVSSKPVITQYWIQVTALTSRKAADAAREVLGENQITADVFTYTDSKNQLFYRVRVGPYTTKSEAEYWRTKISKIDNFKNIASYVTQAQVE